MSVFEVTAWTVNSNEFAGIVYTQKEVLDCLEKYTEVTITKGYVYRDREPLPHMTYRRI